MLTEKTVAASDRRARFVGLAAYEDAGGAVLRDLFADDDCGGWLQDAALLSRLVDEKLKALGESVAAEGWKWVEIAIDFPYGHTDDLRQLDGVPADLSKREKAKFEKLKTEFDQLNADYADAEELPEEVDARLGELEDLLAPFQSRPAIYAPEDMARAGAFISIGRDGAAVIERGFVRPDDEPANDAESADDTDAGEGEAGANGAAPRAAITLAGKSIDEEDDDDNGIKPLSDRLISELTAHRTLALRDALARNPRAAMTLLLHKLCSDAFLHGGQHGCLEASVHRVSLVAQSPDLKECASAKAIAERHDAWQGDVPEDDAALWAWLEALDDDSRAALLAHVVSFGVNAVQERANPYGGASADSLRRRIEQADRVARAVQLDMVESGWRPTIENYVGRVPKPRILEAVREAKGEQAAGLIDHLKKADMAREAERLLADTGWLPEPLRLDDLDAALPAFLAEETAPAPSRARSA
jgi:ParB family chromosome partitioning protein